MGSFITSDAKDEIERLMKINEKEVMNLKCLKIEFATQSALLGTIKTNNKELYSKLLETKSECDDTLSEVRRLKETIKQMENNYKKNSLSANASHLALQNINQDLTNQLIASENENKKILEQIEPKNMQINKLLEISHSSSSSAAEINHLKCLNNQLGMEITRLNSLIVSNNCNPMASNNETYSNLNIKQEVLIIYNIFFILNLFF